jgi:Histone methylation protein DOT1
MTMNDEGNYQDRVVFGIATRSHSHVENVNTHTIPMNDEGKDQDGFVSGIATRSLSLVENARQSIGKIEEQTRRKRKLELEEGRIMSFLFMKDTEGPHSKAADPNANTTIVQRITKIDAPVIQPYSLERYTEIFTGDCDLLALTDAECSYDFRREDVIGRTQRKAIYGEILPPAAHFMLQTIAQLKPGSVFCDLGHGAAHLVLQAAFTTGCESRGIELMKFRHSVAESLLEYMQNRFPVCS